MLKVALPPAALNFESAVTFAEIVKLSPEIEGISDTSLATPLLSVVASPI